MTGYYRRYLKNYSKRTAPLFSLLSNATDSNTRKPKATNQVSSKMPIKWTDKHRAILNLLIDDLTSSPVMACPDVSLPSIIHTDAPKTAWEQFCTRSKMGRCVLLDMALEP
ncbi:hypothetical protein HOLleu_20315 [Holothuria leucospilota]|uniref:Uncharacterized protein n=1 Tax=Holothuria leucospilota TaxID=206669 RepID=A0A9Q1C1F8_HOLLE|nr:hypothetical protein HOLleu_20315 [Holothuria leucospilota]